jgi:hypothetical protein
MTSGCKKEYIMKGLYFQGLAGLVSDSATSSGQVIKKAKIKSPRF